MYIVDIALVIYVDYIDDYVVAFLVILPHCLDWYIHIVVTYNLKMNYVLKISIFVPNIHQSPERVFEIDEHDLDYES